MYKKERLFTFEDVRVDYIGYVADLRITRIKISHISPTVKSRLREFYAEEYRNDRYGKNPARYTPIFDHDDNSVIIGVFTGHPDYKARFKDLIERARGSSYVNLTIRYDFGMTNPTVESSETIFPRSPFDVVDARLIANGCWTKEDDSMDEKTRRYRQEIRIGALAKAYWGHGGRYPWGSGESRAQTVPGIKKVYFNKPATVVIWEDDTKTVVKCQPGEKYDTEKGLAMAIAKKALGNTGKWYDTFKKELPRPAPKKRVTRKPKKTEGSGDEKD